MMQQLRNASEWALMVALVFGAGALAQAADQDDNDGTGRIVHIGPNSSHDNAATIEENGEALDDQQPAPPKLWLGILGGPVTPELRAHIDVPEGQGLLVREIVPDSPASKAGLQKFDVLLRANDVDLHEMRDLLELVRTVGEQKAQITLELLRHGKRESVFVTPAERPANVAVQGFGGQPGEGWGGGAMAGQPGDALQLFQQFGQGQPGDPQPFEFRMFGPGQVMGQAFGGAKLPHGVSVSIQKQGDEPAHITVKRGGETWEVVGDDPQSLEQLPADVRPMVEQMLAGNQVRLPIPEFGQGPGGPIMHQMHGNMQQRLEEMEKHLQQLEQRLGEKHDSGDAK